jgi:long-chain acyl-CoA synthetase
MKSVTATGMSLEEARAALTAPGAPFEIEQVMIRGILTRIWKNTPESLAVLARQARTHGERLFTIYAEERISYEASFRATATLARWLSAQGIRKSDRVALGLRNLPEWPVIFFAVTSLGAIAVPMNAWWTGGELANALADSGASMLFCDEERAERIASYLPSLVSLRRVVVARPFALKAPIAVSLDDLIGHPTAYASLPPTELPQAEIVSDDPATIFYTSGTGGEPRGCLGTHRNLVTQILTSGYAAARNLLRSGASIPLPRPRVRLITVPLFHVTGCTAGLISGLPAGNTNVYMRKWDALEAMRLIQRERVNLAGGVPTMVWELLDHPKRASFDLSSLETIAFGGAPAAAELVRRIRDDLGAVPGVGWGMTETMSTVTSVSGEDFLARPGSCGLPVPVADIKVSDPLTGVDRRTGEIGELWVKGPMIASGYWNRTQDNASRTRYLATPVASLLR